MTRFVFATPRCWLEAVATSNVHPVKAVTRALEGEADVTVVDGQISLDPPPTAVLRLPLRDLKTDNAFYDGELRRRLHAERFPVVTGHLREVEQTSSVSFRVRGDLTLHGVTQSVVGEISVIPRGPTALEARGELRFDIRGFGLAPPKLLMLRVEPEVRVTFGILAELDGDAGTARG